ncbi:MAG: Ig-like domain-containing protein [Burkholderiales bacterium]|nr:Ig-like domain-containing protein [Burkholderiales bacterium]
MRIKQLVSVLSCTTILFGCVSGVNSSAPSQNIDLQAATKTHAISQSVINDNLVFADSLGVLPLSEANGHNYLFRINNASAEKYTLVSLSLDGKSGETEVENEVLSASAAACSGLDAYSSCSIQLTPKTTKSANTMLVIKLKDSSGKIKELQQMVRMSASIFSANGIAFANDLEQVVTADGNYSIALPVILSADFDDIQVANGSLQCDGGYSEGNACTYLISGKSLSDNSIVSAEIIGYRGGVEVAKVSQDILVKTTAQASLLMSQGTSTTDHATSEVIVYNNGNATAHGLKLVPDAQLKLVSGAECLSHDLPAHSACRLNVANASESGGYAGLSLRAADADITRTQLRNMVSREKLDLDFSASGSLDNVLINTVVATQTISIKNTSDRQLRDFNIQLASVPAVPGLKINIHDCTKLAKNHSCSVVLTYAPNSIVNNSVNLIATATYTDDNNQPSQLLRNYRVNYSSIQGAGVLSSSEFNDFEVLSDGVASQRQSFTLKNTKAGINTKLTAIGLETAVSGLVVNNGTCSSGSIILGGKSCTGSITYGAVSSPVVNQSSSLKYSYSITTSNSNTYNDTSNTFKLNAKRYAAIIEAGAITVVDPKPLTFEGTGDKDKPYKFIALKGRNKLVLEGKVTNKGNAPAKGFKLTGLDNNLVTTTGTCSLTGLDLAPNASCSLKVVVPADSLFDASAFNHTSITDLALTASYRYSDQTGDSSKVRPMLTKHIQFTRNWANVQYSNVTITEDAAAFSLSVTATHSSVNSNFANDVYPITITPTAPSVLHFATVTPCQITKSNSGCVAKVSFPKTNYPASSTQKYNINLEARGKSLDAANAVFSQVQVLLIPIEETLHLTNTGSAVAPSATATATTKKYGGPLSVPYTSVGFLVAPWSDAKFNDNSLSWTTYPDPAKVNASVVEVPVINIDDGKPYILKVAGQTSNQCYWYELNSATSCDSNSKYAKLEINNSLNEALPAGSYKGDFDLIAQGWHDSSFVKRIKVNIDWQKIDLQAPKIVNVTPSNFSYVNASDQINVEFSQPLDRNTVNLNSFYLTDSSGSKVNGTIAFLTDKQITFKPSPALVKGLDYTINLDTNRVGNSKGTVANFSGVWTSKFTILNLLGSSSSWPHTYVTQLRNQYSQKWANVLNGNYRVGTSLIQYQREFGRSASGFKIKYAGTVDMYGARFDISPNHDNTLQIGNASFSRLTRDVGQWYIHYNKDDLSYTFISTLEGFSRGTPSKLNLEYPNYSDYTLLTATNNTYVDSSGKRSDRWIVGPRYDNVSVNYQIINPNNGCSWDVWDPAQYGGSNPQKQIIGAKPNDDNRQKWSMWLQLRDGYHIINPYSNGLRVALMTNLDAVSNQYPTVQNQDRSTFDVIFPPDLDGTMLVNRSQNTCLKVHGDKNQNCAYGVQAVSCNVSDSEQIWHLNHRL